METPVRVKGASTDLGVSQSRPHLLTGATRRLVEMIVIVQGELGKPGPAFSCKSQTEKRENARGMYRGCGGVGSLFRGPQSTPTADGNDRLAQTVAAVKDMVKPLFRTGYRSLTAPTVPHSTFQLIGKY